MRWSLYDNKDIHFILKLVILFFRRIIAGLLFQDDSVDRDIEAMYAMNAMKDHQIRAVLDEHWAASAAGDLEKEHDI